MTTSELLSLFVNSFLSAFVLPLSTEITWFSWLAFHPEKIAWVTAVAIIGSLLGLLVSYAIGWVIALDRNNMPLPEEKYQKAARFAKRYLVWLFLVPWIPLLPVLAVGCGFLRLPVWLFAALALAGRLIYYGFHLIIG